MEGGLLGQLQHEGAGGGERARDDTAATDRTIGWWIGLLPAPPTTAALKVIEQEVSTLIGHVSSIALGYDVNDHDQLRHDPMMAILAGKLEARWADCAPRGSRR